MIMNTQNDEMCELDLASLEGVSAGGKGGLNLQDGGHNHNSALGSGPNASQQVFTGAQ
jgi:hypothetical protein